MTTISIIIPAYNEENYILKTLQRISQNRIENFDFEVLVIDDGSSDKTLSLLKSHSELFTKLIERPSNGGKGAAVLSGLVEATGDYILFQDADLEYDPKDYAKLLEPVRLFDADIVMGSRMIASPISRVSYFWHKVGNNIITFMFNLLNNTTFTDIYSCYLLYRRQLVHPENIKSKGWEQHAEILSEAKKEAKIIFEVPISYYGRSYEEGKKIRGYHAISVIWMIIKKKLIG